MLNRILRNPSVVKFSPNIPQTDPFQGIRFANSCRFRWIGINRLARAAVAVRSAADLRPDSGAHHYPALDRLLEIPVATTLPCQVTSLGIPTFSDKTFMTLQPFDLWDRSIGKSSALNAQLRTTPTIADSSRYESCRIIWREKIDPWQLLVWRHTF